MALGSLVCLDQAYVAEIVMCESILLCFSRMSWRRYNICKGSAVSCPACDYLTNVSRSGWLLLLNYLFFCFVFF